MISIKDNFLSQENLSNIYNTITKNNFPWCITDITEYSDEKMLCHDLYNNFQPISHYAYLADEIIKQLNPLSLVRVKFNLHMKSNKITEYPFHTDNESDKCTSSILYLNDNDGYTIVKDKKIQSESNRLITFPSNVKHTGTNCTDKEFRVLLNLVYISD